MVCKYSLPIPWVVSALCCLLEEQTQTNRPMKSCSASLTIREMWVKTSEVPSHTCQNVYYQKDEWQQVSARMRRRRILAHRQWECALEPPSCRPVWRFLKNHVIQWPDFRAYTQRKRERCLGQTPAVHVHPSTSHERRDVGVTLVSGYFATWSCCFRHSDWLTDT